MFYKRGLVDCPSPLNGEVARGKRLIFILLASITAILSGTALLPGPKNISLAYPGSAGKIGTAGSNNPITKENGAKWRIGYCESESFNSYTDTLAAIVKGLAELGWITGLDGFDQAVNTRDSKKIWHWLAAQKVSPDLQFVADAFYNLKDSPKGTEEKIIQRLQQEKDLDLMLAMGTRAGVALANNRHNTNIFVFEAANAVRSGIVKSAEDSGLDHVWAHVDPQCFERQLKVFHDIVKFKKLGLVYENSEAARVYSAVSEVEKLAAGQGFGIVRDYVNEPANAKDYERYYRQVGAAYAKLSKQVDAMYVTVACLEENKLAELFQPFYQNKIPVFSQSGEEEVEHGALMTVSVTDEVNLGRFGADNISRCLHGTKPRQLPQSFQSAPKLILNAEVARKIDFKIPFKLIIVTDQVYREIAR